MQGRAPPAPLNALHMTVVAFVRSREPELAAAVAAGAGPTAVARTSLLQALQFVAALSPALRESLRALDDMAPGELDAILGRV